MKLTRITKKRANELLKTLDLYVDEITLKALLDGGKSKIGSIGGLFYKKAHEKYINANLTNPINEKESKIPSK